MLLRSFFAPDDKCITLCTGHQSYKLNVRKVDLSEMSDMCRFLSINPIFQVLASAEIRVTLSRCSSSRSRSKTACACFKLRFIKQAKFFSIEVCGRLAARPLASQQYFCSMIGQLRNRNKSLRKRSHQQREISHANHASQECFPCNGFMAGRESQPRQVSPIALAIPANRGSKPPLVWLRAPLLV